MASLSCIACSNSTIQDVSSLIKISTLSANNGVSPLLHTKTNQSFDPYRLGLIFDGAKYRQTYAIRCSDVGPNKSSTLESILDLFQETKMNHLKLIGLNDDGFGTTNEMIRNNLIWAVIKMHVEVDHYPIWGDIIDIDTWLVESKGLGVRRDWIVQCHKTGFVFARGTSTWVMMNHKTRRLARMSNALKDELSPLFVNKQVINHTSKKIEKVDADNVVYATSNIKPKRSDFDMNNHVNNVKLLSWMLETFPDRFVETHQLCSAELEFRKECQSSDLVESLVGPNQDKIISDNDGQLTYTHLLHTHGNNKLEEIVRGKTTWKRILFAPMKR